MKLFDFHGMEEGGFYPDAVFSCGAVRCRGEAVEYFAAIKIPLPWQGVAKDMYRDEYIRGHEYIGAFVAIATRAICPPGTRRHVRCRCYKWVLG